MIERVTKLEAARRQLFTAIELFFQRGDSVSIHTLASAADGILLAIAKKTNPEVALMSPHNPDNPRINPEMRKEWVDILHGPRNFFKHGSRDANQTFDFRPESTAFHILNCVMLYEVLSKAREPEIRVFSTWMFLKYPNLLKPGPFKEAIEKAALENQPPDPDDLEVFALSLRNLKESNGH